MFLPSFHPVLPPSPSLPSSLPPSPSLPPSFPPSLPPSLPPFLPFSVPLPQNLEVMKVSHTKVLQEMEALNRQLKEVSSSTRTSIISFAAAFHLNYLSYTHIRTHTHARTHKHTHEHTHAHAHTHTYTHTHTPLQEKRRSSSLQSELKVSAVSQRAASELQEMVSDLRSEKELLKQANDRLMKKYETLHVLYHLEPCHTVEGVTE